MASGFCMYCGAPYSGGYRFCMGCGRSLEKQFEEQERVQKKEAEPISDTQSRPLVIETSSAHQSTIGKTGASSLDNLDLEAIFASHPYDDDEPEDATTVYATESASMEPTVPVSVTQPHIPEELAEDVPEEALPLSLDVLLGTSETVDSAPYDSAVGVSETAEAIPSGSFFGDEKTSNHNMQDVAAEKQLLPQSIESQLVVKQVQTEPVTQPAVQQQISQPTPQSSQQSVLQSTPGSALQSESQPAVTTPFDEDMDAPTLVFRREPVPMLRRLRSGEEYSLELPAVIGRGSAATLRIAGNRFISRVHARIEKTADGYAIADRASANRTMVNGRSLQGTALYSLRDGDHIQLADEEFVFSIIKPDAVPASRLQEETGESR